MIAREPFAGWTDTHRIFNGLVEARVLADVGPRVVALGYVGGPNLFYLRGRSSRELPGNARSRI